MKSLWFSIVLPVTVQILLVPMVTVFPPAAVFSGQVQLRGAFDASLFTALVFWPVSWTLVTLSFPLAFIQMGCAKSLARDNASRFKLFFVGLLHFSVAILLIAIVLMLWWVKDWRP